MKLRSRALKNLPIVMLMTKEGPELGSSSKAGFHAATSASAHDAPTAVYQWRSFATAEFFWVTLAQGPDQMNRRKRKARGRLIWSPYIGSRWPLAKEDFSSAKIPNTQTTFLHSPTPHPLVLCQESYQVVCFPLRSALSWGIQNQHLVTNVFIRLGCLQCHIWDSTTVWSIHGNLIYFH